MKGFSNSVYEYKMKQVKAVKSKNTVVTAVCSARTTSLELVLLSVEW